MVIRKIIEKIRKRVKNYTSLVCIYISKSRLIHNLNEWQKIAPNWQIAPVLKSNAYGHGLKEIGQILNDTNIPFAVCDAYFEANYLRIQGFKKPILIIGYSPIDNILNNRLKNLSFTLHSIEKIDEAIKFLHKPEIFHLKIDTGMGRQGILENEVDEAISRIKRSPNIILEGVCSHFSDSDNQETQSYTERQITVWNKVVLKFKKEFPNIKYYHISATCGHFFSKKIIANASRLGLGLYGIKQGAPGEKNVNILPVMEIKTIITGIKTLGTGESVGYGRTFTTSKPTKIATIPFGYYEGLKRNLSNKGFVKIGKKFAPIVGRVSMNIATIDVSEISEAKIGTEVVVISNNENEKNSIQNMSRLANLIPYEIAVGIPEHLRRVVE